MRKHPNVVNARDLEWDGESSGERFGYLRKRLASAAGGQKLGCSLYEVPPGRRAFPYHYHFANEEAIYVLEGEGKLRIGNGKVAVSAGDYVALPGGEEDAHQVINDSDGPLRYLCFSTMIEPDVAAYPDSGKLGVFAGSAPGGPKEKRTLKKFLRADAETDYYEGE